MANLETLELQLKGSAESASEGISRVISSLSALSGALTKPFSDLVDFRKELEAISKIKLPDFGKQIGSSVSRSMKQAKDAAKVAKEEFKKAESVITELVKAQPFVAKPTEKWFEKSPKTMAQIQAEGEEERLRTLYHYISNAKTPEEANLYARNAGTTVDAVKDHFRDIEAVRQQIQGLFDTLNQPVNMNLADAVNQMNGIGQATKSAEESMKAFLGNMDGDSALAKDNPELAQFKQTMSDAGISAKDFTSNLVDLDGELKSKKKDASEASTALQNVAQSTAEVGRNSAASVKHTSAFGKAMSSFGRIARTMLMRSVIKNVFKSFSESWKSMYQFSKATDGVFAKSVDKMRGLLSATTTNILTAFAPAIQAIVPIVNVVAGAIQYLCKAIQWLFSLLGMSSEFFGATTDSINKYAESAGGGGSATKGMLASFDELNVISSAGGGGGGGGGGFNPSGLSGVVSDEMAKMQIIVGESLLAIGLILACTGHIPLGVGLMAIGAGAIVKTLVSDWGKLTATMQSEIATIMAACAVGFLAIGLILAMTGHLGIGIGMMALGAANLAGLEAMGFNGMLTEEIRKQVGLILAIGGTVLFVAGVILALTGHIPLGIGMMIAGGAAVAGAAALNWDLIVQKVKTIFGSIKEFLVRVWDAVSKAAVAAWDAVKKWWEDSGVGPAVRKAWSGVTSFFSNLWQGVSEFAHNAWSSISTWWHTNVTANVEKEGIWGGVKGFFKGLWNGIKDLATVAWNNVKRWWENSWIKAKVEELWNNVKSVVEGVWNSVKDKATEAWNSVATWWETSGLGSTVRTAWSGVSSFFSELWRGVSDFAHNAWNSVSTWWHTHVTENVKKEGIWGGVKGFFAGLWGDAAAGTGIAGWAAGAWNSVKQWWKSGIGASIEKAWEGVQSFFTSMWEAITRPLRELWNLIQNIFGLNKSATYTLNIDTTVREKVQKVVENTQPTFIQGVANSITSGSVGGSKGLSNNEAFKIGISSLFRANGAYDIPMGDLFIANEAGAELVGSINGKTSVANQQQIIEGISRGVESANSEQNVLLREQNNLLRGILEKELSVNFGTSASFGRTIKRSLDAYNGLTGG